MKGRVVVTLPLLLRSSAFVSPRRQQQKRGAPTSIFAEEGVNGSFVNGSSKVNGSGDQSSDKSSGTSSVPSVGEVTSDGRLRLLQGHDFRDTPAAIRLPLTSSLRFWSFMGAKTHTASLSQ
ncbi:hypothetical protein THAOC_33754 [Thalassiosira oceanica]|uniref:Secreted protein n=1 Tax=Thalassiosira oceanica TaxID=159749 RepID=K0RLC9_THAOC|nr:hypothetical protein THAOC_33754 [Thalassiosira oceanica]|eukprot:EJK47517.1 hypothetical protein THAOC_33754 [Thalassiosira oceanica]